MSKMPTQQEAKVYKNPTPTTDLVIEHKSQDQFGIVLIERKNFPHGIALPGGYAELGLSYEDNAVKEAREETGLEVIIESPEHPLCVHSNPLRDPRGHITSATYIAQGRGLLKAGDDAKKVFHYTIPQVIDLVTYKRNLFAFDDHARAIIDYLNHRGYMR